MQKQELTAILSFGDVVAAAEAERERKQMISAAPARTTQPGATA